MGGVVGGQWGGAGVVEALLAKEERLNGRLHGVVDAAPASALEPGEGRVVGVEHHLLRLARINPHEQHPAVTKPYMGGLHDDRRPAQQNDLMTPVELVGFPRRKTQLNVGRSRRLPALLAPVPRITSNGIVSAVVAKPTQLLK